MTDVHYRAPLIEDAGALAALGRETFIDTFGHLYSAANLNAFLDRVHGLPAVAAELADPARAYRVAEVDGALVGYAKIGPMSLPVANPPATALELKQLYVLPAYKGQGVAATLMAWALDQCHARGARDVYLSVYADNPRAQAFYRRHGFTIVGHYKFMVGDHADDEHIMHLQLWD